VLRATEDVEDSFSLLVQSEVRRVEIAALQRARDRSQEAYQAGVIGLTDVLDADRQLLVARDDLALTKEAAAKAAVGSFRALGGGWTPWICGLTSFGEFHGQPALMRQPNLFQKRA
jgi:outer membrane protein TolC